VNISCILVHFFWELSKIQNQFFRKLVLRRNLRFFLNFCSFFLSLLKTIGYNYNNSQHFNISNTFTFLPEFLLLKEIEAFSLLQPWWQTQKLKIKKIKNIHNCIKSIHSSIHSESKTLFFKNNLFIFLINKLGVWMYFCINN